MTSERIRAIEEAIQALEPGTSLHVGPVLGLPPDELEAVVRGPARSTYEAPFEHFELSAHMPAALLDDGAPEVIAHVLVAGYRAARDAAVIK